MVPLAILLSLLLSVFVVFHILLALGFPYGHASWGGRQSKVLPKHYRIASGVSSFFFLFSIAVVLSKAGVIAWFDPSFSNGFLWFLTAFMGVSSITNALSPSAVERRWVPLIVAICVAGLLLQLHSP